jgi:predicted NAD/FAD-dependent oxidoreductase
LAGFDAVVVATPAPEARCLLQDVRLQPDATKALEAVRMLPCWAVLAAFDARVPTRFDGAFVSSSPLGWIARDRSKPQRSFAETWVLHAGTAWSAAHVDDRADAVGPFLLNAFADLVRGPMPKPVSLTAQRWRYATADPPLARGVLGDRERRLAICGDWCLGNRIEDAWISGVEAAKLIVE